MHSAICGAANACSCATRAGGERARRGADIDPPIPGGAHLPRVRRSPTRYRRATCVTGRIVYGAAAVMKTKRIKSADSTTIAFEAIGEGPPLVLVGGALCDRTAT